MGETTMTRRRTEPVNGMTRHVRRKVDEAAAHGDMAEVVRLILAANEGRDDADA